ncbi:MAG TPA: biopolymer transporter ExbD [Planctomycetota bacterium]|jgi:biopolymer transport protein ExbD|nr:biopolymer transporter ExbD [Planctomycetota bacterium]
MSDRFASPAAEESVACNLIPMIDIMFLLLLFFMLGADMTQRQLEEVRLPKAEQCKPDDGTHCFELARVTVNVFHPAASERVVCPAFAAGGVCRDESHWQIAVRGENYSQESVRGVLRDEADRLRSTEPSEDGGPPASLRELMIRADADAPYSVVQGVIESCAAVRLYKIEVGAAQPSASAAR